MPERHAADSDFSPIHGRGCSRKTSGMAAVYHSYQGSAFNGSEALTYTVVPSVRTSTFREPWGLVANEAMHQGLPVIATTEVGAAAGGLVRHERNGLVVPAGDPAALRAAIERLRDDAETRATLGRHAGRDVAAYSPETWAAGVSAALASVGASRRPDQSL